MNFAPCARCGARPSIFFHDTSPAWQVVSCCRVRIKRRRAHDATEDAIAVEEIQAAWTAWNNSAAMTWSEFRHATAELQREFEAAFVRQFQDQFPGMTYAEMRKRVPQDVVNDLFAPYDDRWQQLFSEYRAVSRR